MTKDREREVFRRLQAQAEAEWPTPRPVGLDGSGPFELPVCGNLSLRYLGPDKPFLLVLETTELGQKVLLPVEMRALGALKALVDLALKKYLENTSDDGPKN